MKPMLAKLVAFNSVFPHEEKLGLFLAARLKKLGFKVQKQYLCKNRFNLLAEKGKGKKSVLFYAHLDTVGVASGWKTDPFKLVQKGDRLYGLGSRDMKSGIVILLKALEKFKPQGFKIKLAFCCDEENISQGAYKLADSDFSKDVRFIISADSGKTFSSSRLPFRFILGRRGRCVLQVLLPGLTCHGAFPQKGINALEEASRLILSLSEFKHAKNSYLQDSSLFTRGVEAKMSGLSLPQEAVVVIDKQLVPPETPSSVIRQFKAFGKDLYQKGVLAKSLKKGYKVSLKPRKTPYLKPFIQDKNHKLVVLIDNIIKSKYGFVDHGYGLSVGDDNVLYHQLKKPLICLGVAGGNPHEANEWVSLKSMQELEFVYRKLLENIIKII